MRNFLQIGQIDPVPLLHAIAINSALWNSNPVRTWHPQSAHKVVDDIVLRYNDWKEGEDFLEKVCSEIQVVNYPAWDLLPQAREIVMGVMGRVAGLHLGRVFISRLSPGKIIEPHTDAIPPAEAVFPDKIPPYLYYNRYHVALQSLPGNIFQAGQESVYMSPGSVWWFNNRIEHACVNNSADDRIHLVIDIHTGE